MPDTLRFWIDRLPTPIGELRIVADEAGALRATDWTDYCYRMDRLLSLHYRQPVMLDPKSDPHGLTSALRAYFNGRLDSLDALPVATNGTPFQRSVWAALRRIPCGATLSYSQLAAQIGKPSALRAVGLANGANPIGIVVPCHRVIGANGALTGYGGGIERKRWLLHHEGAFPGILKFEAIGAGVPS